MNPKVFGECVRGASHIRADKECQDSSKKINSITGVTIMAVADGHGSESCPYSKTGAEIAVNVFCKVMVDFCSHYRNNMEPLITYLNREGDTKVAQVIDAEWKRRVYKQHLNKKREFIYDKDGNRDKEAVYRQYGSTLLGMMITDEYVFAFQIGDGDISYIDKSGVQSVIDGDKILGTETHSLSRKSSWKNAVSRIVKKDSDKGLPYMYMLSTDGMANSFVNHEEFQRSCKDYFDMINEYGCEQIADNLREWLGETSAFGCGDDITVMFAYYG